MMENIEIEKIEDNIPEKNEWYYNPWVIAGLIFTFGPLGLFPLWFRPKTRLWIKTFVSILIISGTVVFVFSALDMYKSTMKTYYDILEIYPEFKDVGTNVDTQPTKDLK